MTPAQRALAKQRIAKATKQMRDCGFPKEKIITAIKRLLKSLDFNWELIEAENYSILVDAIISFEEPEAFPQEESSRQRSHGNREIASSEIPLLRKRRRLDQQEQPSGGEIVLKKPKFEQDPLLCGCTDIVLSPPEHSSGSGKSKSDPVDALAVAKGKGIIVDSSSQGHSDLISRGAHRRSKGLSIGGGQPLVNFEGPKVEPDVEPITKKVGSNHTCDRGDNLSISSKASVPETSLRSTAIEKDSNLKGPKVRDGYPSNGDGMEATPKQKLNKNEHAKYTEKHPPSPKLELASSANRKVKLILSWEGIDANFEMPSSNSILKAVEDRMRIHSKNTPPEFSIKKIVTEICQMISEQNKQR